MCGLDFVRAKPQPVCLCTCLVCVSGGGVLSAVFARVIKSTLQTEVVTAIYFGCGRTRLQDEQKSLCQDQGVAVLLCGRGRWWLVSIEGPAYESPGVLEGYLLFMDGVCAKGGGRGSQFWTRALREQEGGPCVELWHTRLVDLMCFVVISAGNIAIDGVLACIRAMWRRISSILGIFVFHSLSVRSRRRFPMKLISLDKLISSFCCIFFSLVERL